MLLQLNNINFKYPDSAMNVLENVSVQFPKGFTGIIGVNGSGKTTLLKIAGGTILPSSGNVTRKGIIHYCEQRTDIKPENSDCLIASYDKRAYRIKDMLGIEDEMFGRWESLSHGERKRCQIAAALFLNPDILLIDEPTNHIDSRTRDVLLSALKSFGGIGVIVSHDRQLLDELCSYIFSLDHPGSKIMQGNYSAFETERGKELTFLVAQKENISKEIKKLEKEVKSRKQKAEASDKLGSKKNISSKDHDAKSKIDLGRLTGKDATEGNIYARLKNRMENMINSRNDMAPTAKRKLGVEIEGAASAKRLILFEKENRLELGDKKFLDIPDLHINRKDKTGITGPNGSGKSTLIKKLVNSLNEKSFPFAYIPQEVLASEAKLLLDEARNLNQEDKGKIFTIISRLNSDPKRLLDSILPSPGEVRKLMLARAILEKQELIIMDEPTNHMDLASIKCVEEALQEFSGTLLLVSHDNIFLENIINVSWNIEQLDDYSYKMKFL